MFEVNSLNRKDYANRGLRTLIEFRHVIGTELYEPGSTSVKNKDIIYKKYHNWIQLKLAYQNYFQHIGRLSLGFYFENILSSQTFFKNYSASILMAPSFEVIPESRTMFLPAFRAYNYTAAGLQAVFSLFKNVDYRMEVYVFQPYQELILQQDQTTQFGEIFANRLLMAGSALVYHSPLGPVSVNLNFYDKSDDKFSLIFNIGYILFNKRPLQ